MYFDTCIAHNKILNISIKTHFKIEGSDFSIQHDLVIIKIKCVFCPCKVFNTLNMS